MVNNFNGCKLSPVDLRDYKIRASAGLALPDAYELKFEHKIKSQGSVGSCVAHSVAEILEYYAKDVTLSTNFIYGTRKELYGDSGTGMSLVDACKTVKNYGDMLLADCPGNIEAPKCFNNAKEYLKDSEKLSRAYYYRIDSYYKCKSNEDIKAAIMNYGPVLAAVKWYNSSYMESYGTIKFRTDATWGYHAIMLYGWNERGFYFQNSWGESFGNKGCAILPYEYKIEEARCLVDHDNSKDSTVDIVIPNVNNRQCVDTLYKGLNNIINFLNRRKK